MTQGDLAALGHWWHGHASSRCYADR
jgi:hypothetical protein